MPKRCGHTQGKDVVDRTEAERRIRAAVDARQELVREEGLDIVLVARTDAAGVPGHGVDEAIARCSRFHALGAEVTFLEAPLDEATMQRYCSAVEGHCMANMLEGGGRTPMLPLPELGRLGFRLAAYPLTLLSAAVRAQQRALAHLMAHGLPPRAGNGSTDALLPFKDLCTLVGFDDYDATRQRYK